MTKSYKKLIRTLHTLFEMDRADLDFGFYRIMHAKAEQVQEFIEKDLLQTVKEAFGEQSSQNSPELLEQARQKVIQTLGEDALDADGNLKPSFASIPAGKQYQDDVAQILRQKADASAETDIYDHLCRFFERYYEGGDFVSRRYYARETSGKAAPYAIPYNGEEVKLHWANADQYYIKTTENYNNFTFDLHQAREIQTALKNTPLLAGLDKKDKTPLRVHFRIKEAAEGEHGNVKATDATKRFFVLHSEQPVEKDEAGELVVNFEYKPLPGGKYAIDAETEKQLKGLYGSLNKGDMPAFDMTRQILTAVESMEGMAEYCRLLQVLSPTEKLKKRPLLVRYLDKYTAANTMDYFIHKDLGGFLRRELDFYIKNEVMHLDDIENADVPAVESYFARIKVLRRVAGKLIDFLAQLEDFQKKLWLKKKFVVETNYCVTLDRVPEALYGEIVDCEGQWLEWVGLGFLTTDDTEDTEKRKEILGKEPYLVLDTKFYGEGFKERLLASFDNLDEQCDGLLIHSENFQALNLLQERYREQVKCVYIDPPYNTGNGDFPYKDGYKNSSWFSMMVDRVFAASSLMSNNALFFQQIGDDESAHSRLVLEEVFAERKNSVVVRRGIKNVQAQFEDISRLSLGHDVIHICSKNKGERIPHLHQVLENGKPGKWDTFWRGTDRPTMRYELLGQNPETGQWRWEKNRAKKACQNYTDYLHSESPNKTLDEWYAENLQAGIDLNFVRKNQEETIQYYVAPQTFRLVSDNWLDISSSGSFTDFPHEKSLTLLRRVIGWIGKPGDVVLDYFAGSGSTGHAAIRFSTSGSHKYILVEMGDYFDTVLKPRIQKIIYSENWKDGKPKPGTKGNLNGISHTFKYLRLESYEDTLNNLRFDESEERDKVLAANSSLKEDYTLNYLLDVETRGSQSLLNIDDFADPRRYILKVKKTGSEEYNTQDVDLIGTFNFLIGLRVTHLAASQTFKAAFKRNPDPELPEDQHTKLLIDGTIKQDETGPWWFRKIEGWLPNDPANPNNGQKEKVLIVWRNLIGDLEQDNAVLDEWFQRNRISSQDFEFDTIYVNGSNNLPNLQKKGDIWKVRLIEEEFMKCMWEVN